MIDDEQAALARAVAAADKVLRKAMRDEEEIIPERWRARFAEVVWMNVAAACAANPPNAKRLVMVGRQDIEGAVALAFEEMLTASPAPAQKEE